MHTKQEERLGKYGRGSGNEYEKTTRERKEREGKLKLARDEGINNWERGEKKVRRGARAEERKQESEDKNVRIRVLKITKCQKTNIYMSSSVKDLQQLHDSCPSGARMEVAWHCCKATKTTEEEGCGIKWVNRDRCSLPEHSAPVSNPEHDVSQTPVHFPATFATTKPGNSSQNNVFQTITSGFCTES